MKITFENEERKYPQFKDLSIGTVFSIAEAAIGRDYGFNLYIKTETNTTPKNRIENGEKVEVELTCNAVQLLSGVNVNVADTRPCRVWETEIKVWDAGVVTRDVGAVKEYWMEAE